MGIESRFGTVCMCSWMAGGGGRTDGGSSDIGTLSQGYRIGGVIRVRRVHDLAEREADCGTAGINAQNRLRASGVFSDSEVATIMREYNAQVNTFAGSVAARGLGSSAVGGR